GRARCGREGVLAARTANQLAEMLIEDLHAVLAGRAEDDGHGPPTRAGMRAQGLACSIRPVSARAHVGRFPVYRRGTGREGIFPGAEGKVRSTSEGVALHFQVLPLSVNRRLAIRISLPNMPPMSSQTRPRSTPLAGVLPRRANYPPLPGEPQQT